MPTCEKNSYVGVLIYCVIDVRQLQSPGTNFAARGVTFAIGNDVSAAKMKFFWLSDFRDTETDDFHDFHQNLMIASAVTRGEKVQLTRAESPLRVFQ